jgi:hypothetical protein
MEGSGVTGKRSSLNASGNILGLRSTPPLPKRPPDMTLARYDFLIESFWGFMNLTGVMSAEDVEEFMLDSGFFDDWSARLDRMSEDNRLAGKTQRALQIGVAEGDQAAIALAGTPEGKALLARVFKRPTH